MNQKKFLFIDRDGTLIREPADQQVDRLEKLEFCQSVIPALLELQRLGYGLVMISNQDGLGTVSFPLADFQQVQDALMAVFTSQGIRFLDCLFCPHFPSDACLCRKPNAGLLRSYLSRPDWDRTRSFVIGDRETDLELAENMGVKAIRFSENPKMGMDWKSIGQTLGRGGRQGRVRRESTETRIVAQVDLEAEGGARVRTGLRYFDHMLEQLAKHGGFQLNLDVEGDLEVDEHHTVEDSALVLGECLKKALGDKVGIGRYGFLLPMDESEAKVALDLSGRAFTSFEAKFRREYVGDLPTELVPHFFRSFADALGATLHIEVKGENTHHMVEAVFKAVGRSVRDAIRMTGSRGASFHQGDLMIAVVDTGGANLASVTNALERLGQTVRPTSDAEEIRRASRVILPGVGAARDSMDRLRSLGLLETLRLLQQPTLGICLGMQLLFERSEEGQTGCLGVLPGTVRRMAPAERRPIPHMGWNQVENSAASPLMEGMPLASYFYFVHSFVVPEGPWVVGDFQYGGPFPAIVQKDNYFGVQFHPERSSEAGAKLLRNFLKL